MFKNIKLTAQKEDYRPAFVLDDVHNASFEGIDVNEPTKDKKEIIYDYKSTNIMK